MKKGKNKKVYHPDNSYKNKFIKYNSFTLQKPKEESKPADKTPLTELYPDATLINNWEELKQFDPESDTHVLEIDEYNGWINVKDKHKKDYDRLINYDEQIKNLDHYLSTHTFYGYTDGRFGGQYRHSTMILQECGFNVIIKNWDGETI